MGADTAGRTVVLPAVAALRGTRRFVAGIGPQRPVLRIAPAFGDNQGDVVVLLLRAESLDVGNDRGDD